MFTDKFIFIKLPLNAYDSISPKNLLNTALKIPIVFFPIPEPERYLLVDRVKDFELFDCIV